MSKNKAKSVKGHVGRLMTIAIIICIMCSLMQPMTVQAQSAEKSSLESLIEETIESDKETFKFGNILQKAYDKLVSVFKTGGKLAKDVAKVVKLYEALNEDSEDYPDRLREFFEEYSKLSTVKRKLVDLCTNVLDAKDKLVESVRRHNLIDLYSEKQLKDIPDGKWLFTSQDETVATVNDIGVVRAVGVGYTKIIVSNANSTDELTYRVFVKKPVLNSGKFSVTKGKTISITVPASSKITEVKPGNGKISVSRSGNTLTVTGNKKGTANLYVGTDEGKTLKYKISVLAASGSGNSSKINDVYKAYEQALKDYSKSENADYPEGIKYTLVFVDGDDIPELAVSEGSAHASGVRLFFYDAEKKKATDLGESFGENGGFMYYERLSMIYDYYFGHGIGGLRFSSIDKNHKVSKSDIFSQGYNWEDKFAYYVNNEECSKSDYDKAYKSASAGADESKLVTVEREDMKGTYADITGGKVTKILKEIFPG